MAASTSRPGSREAAPSGANSGAVIAGSGTPTPAASTAPREGDSWRDTVDSVVLAFVLAFLFRTFEAEAFVIPTGSMAPTLFGQHRDVTCRQCGFQYEVGLASDELNPKGELSAAYRMHSSYCPNCRFPNNVLTDEVFTGDRILVNKAAYDLRSPERWDPIVFKFPGEADVNYIKRLVGLPGEELKIEGGDIWVRPLGEQGAQFRIPRKKPEKQRAIQLPVYDDSRAPQALLAAGFPERWQPEQPAGWATDRAARSYRVDPAPLDSTGWQWLRYRHLLPTADDWSRVLAGQPLENPAAVKPQIITDMYAYNAHVLNLEAGRTGADLPELSPKDDGLQWVGDLTLHCSVEVLSAEGEWLMELVEGARRYRFRCDLKTGRAELFFLDETLSKTERQGGVEFDVGLNKPGTYAVSFANVDNRLCLWIDGELRQTVEFEPGSAKFPEPGLTGPLASDLSPAAVAGRGAKLRISQLRIERDIYYRYATPANPEEYRPMHNDPHWFRELLQNPDSLSQAYEHARSEHHRDLERERERLREGPAPAPRYPFQLRDLDDDAHDEFLVLGDNSPRSNDSRLWSQSPFVERRLLIGKAFWIYWPHGIPFLNGGRGFAVRTYPAETLPEAYDAAGNLVFSRKDAAVPRFSLPFYPQWDRWWKRIR